MKSDYPESAYQEEGTPEIRAALRALAEHDRDQEASQLVEARLMGAFRATNREREWKRRTTYAMAAAAGFALLWFSTIYRSYVASPTETQVHNTKPKSETSSEAVITQPSISPNQPEPTEAPVRRTRRAKRLPPPILAEAGLREITTEFFPLMDSPPPMERGELVRMTVPASTMRRVGLPVSPDRWSDRVQADVLVGQEGIARAIRFVRYEQ